MYISIKEVLKFVKKKGFTDPTEREIKRTVPPGLEKQARKGRVWIGRCGVYGSKMAYSVEMLSTLSNLQIERKRQLKMVKEILVNLVLFGLVGLLIVLMLCL